MERVFAAVVAGGIVIAGAASAERWAAIGAAVCVAALGCQVRRHRDFGDALLRVCAVLLGLFTVALGAAGVWILVLVATSVMDTVKGNPSGGLGVVGIVAALATRWPSQSWPRP